jgi:hypothetical protein
MNQLTTLTQWQMFRLFSDRRLLPETNVIAGTALDYGSKLSRPSVGWPSEHLTVMIDESSNVVKAVSGLGFRPGPLLLLEGSTLPARSAIP